jgi:hypothetical protein
LFKMEGKTSFTISYLRCSQSIVFIFSSFYPLPVAKERMVNYSAISAPKYVSTSLPAALNSLYQSR